MRTIHQHGDFEGWTGQTLLTLLTLLTLSTYCVVLNIVRMHILCNELQAREGTGDTGDGRTGAAAGRLHVRSQVPDHAKHQVHAVADRRRLGLLLPRHREILQARVRPGAAPRPQGAGRPRPDDARGRRAGGAHRARPLSGQITKLRPRLRGPGLWARVDVFLPRPPAHHICLQTHSSRRVLHRRPPHHGAARPVGLPVLRLAGHNTEGQARRRQAQVQCVREALHRPHRL